jgi:hypothetical protein
MSPMDQLKATANRTIEGAKARLRPWRMVLVALAVAAVGCAGVYALHQYRWKIAGQKDYCIRPMDLHLVQTTSWMTPEIAEEIRSTMRGLPPQVSVMDSDATKAMATCLASSPWVRRVDAVRFNAPRSGDQMGGVDIAMSFRRPVAFVEVGEGAGARYVSVDREGVRLSRDASSEPMLGNRLLLVISGVKSQPPRQGQVWSDPAVPAGADVANVFQADAAHDDATRFKLSRIDVSNLGGLRDRKESEIVIYTKNNGTRILWGGPRNKRTEVKEGTPEEKLLCLRRLYLEEGDFAKHFEQIDLVERQLRRLPGDTRARPSLRS